MATSKNAQKPSDEFFDSLVASAIDFLSRSITDLKKRPKYSVINFCIGLEIFLKARLLKEHWAMVVMKPEAAIIEQFRVGNFNSVSMEETIRRLRNVAGERIGREEELSFEQVRKHRNRVVHLFHPAYARRPIGELVREVVVEQCKAWFYLHRLLTLNWELHFRKYGKKIQKLDGLMHKQRIFLKAKFSALKPRIDVEISNGAESLAIFAGACRHELKKQVSHFMNQVALCAKRDLPVCVCHALTVVRVLRLDSRGQEKGFVQTKIANGR